jgi:hypothetical protein
VWEQQSGSEAQHKSYLRIHGLLLLLLPSFTHHAALLESYEDQERLVWEQLSGLVTDAAWLESYAAAAMLKVKEAFQVRNNVLQLCR